MTDAPDSIWAWSFTGGEGGEWYLKEIGLDGDEVEYLLATPARARAEELAEALREALDELDEYYRAEYDTDHPYHQDKLARARDSWADARALLARITQEEALIEIARLGQEYDKG